MYGNVHSLGERYDGWRHHGSPWVGTAGLILRKLLYEDTDAALLNKYDLTT
jgi:hypothetical protein